MDIHERVKMSDMVYLTQQLDPNYIQMTLTDVDTLVPELNKAISNNDENAIKKIIDGSDGEESFSSLFSKYIGTSVFKVVGFDSSKLE
jgi:hypothetical protein